MGWRLLSWFWRDAPVVEPEAVFVRAATGRTVVHGYGSDVRAFATKDADEIDFVNFDFTRSLALVDDEIDTFEDVVVEEGDAALELGLFAESGGIVCARWQGGTGDTGYTLRARVHTVAGRTWDLSGYVFIAAH
jgi:hypothetical protein